jgi:hypothetical protein
VVARAVWADVDRSPCVAKVPQDTARPRPDVAATSVLGHSAEEESRSGCHAVATMTRQVCRRPARHRFRALPGARRPQSPRTGESL